MRRLIPLFLAALSTTTVPAAEPFLEKVDVFKAGERGYRTYRIPGIVVTTSGTVLAYCEARKGGRGDWGTIDIMMRRSLDGGRTWEKRRKIVTPPERVVQNPVALAQNLARPGEITVNNPVAIVETRPGVVHFLYCIEYARCYYMRSDDDGKTFTDPVDITPTFDRFRSDYDWKVLATGPGHPVLDPRTRAKLPLQRHQQQMPGLVTKTIRQHRPDLLGRGCDDDLGVKRLAAPGKPQHGDREYGNRQCESPPGHRITFALFREDNVARRRAWPA